MQPYERDRFRYAEGSRSYGRRRPSWPADSEGLSGGGIYGAEDYDPRRAERADWQRRRGYRYGHADDDRFGNHDADRRVPRDETSRLIAADKVEGTPVYDRDGERVGTVETFMVTKQSGRVEYVVLSFGGFMGLGDGHYPVDWDMLTYDRDRDGYVVDLDKCDLRRSARHS